MSRLTPEAEDTLIKKIISCELSESHYNSLARLLGEYPQNIYPGSSNNEEKANMIVTRANQKEQCDLIERELSNMISFNPTARSLNSQLAIAFGRLYEDLLKSLESMTDDTEEDIKENSVNEHTEFREKLKKKARFSESTRELAIFHKNDNSVIQRKAKKLGYKSYVKIELKVRQLYQSVLAEFPAEQYSAERRLSELLNKLYSFLSDEYKENFDTTDHLYGIIFGTASRCLIFNE
ncbi:hypothetical protein LSG23_03450 [Bacillus velezensis]|uniref:hypothetical protein n=1 Tax=Bacillus velezensis TaxID=492670 RepID=UPI000987F5E2|nr:hypothetical protein [Bacillus velezensis]AQS43102.1 hypothetical protein BVH55_03920 [Bacillus velezensis]QUI65810.1 hypothetical protein GSF05_02590 [Bacillus velezensis]WNR80539.1 hypothetical protein RP314_16890 [Bacillus velezensis]